MVFTFWDIPGIHSHNSLEVLERSLSPICIYSDRGQTIYASQSFLELLHARIEEVEFFDYFASGSTTLAILDRLWERALQGEAMDFFSKTRDGWRDIECSLQFNRDAGLMFLTAKEVNSDATRQKLIAEYEQAIAQFRCSSLATVLISPDGVVVQCNQCLYDLLGLSDRETIYLEKYVHPEDRLVDAALRQKLLEGEIDSYTIEKRLVAENQEVLWMNATVSLISLPGSVDGYRHYFVALLEDITESRKIYNALIRTEEKWKAFVLNSPYLFVQTSNNGQIIYISPAVEKLLGYQEDELLGRHVTELIHPGNFNEFELAFQLWINQVQPKNPGIECWWRAKSGKWISLYIQGQPFPSVLEIDGVVITGYNITDRKCLEVELKANEEKLKSLIFNIPGAVFRCDATYTMKYISDGIEEMTGYPAASFLNNQAQSYLSIIHPDDISLITDSLIQSVLDRYRCSIEYRIIDSSGHIRWISERKQGVFDQQGNLLWLDGVLLDISDRKRAEAERQQTEVEPVSYTHLTLPTKA
jgi:PAS domain S-box-containing protein